MRGGLLILMIQTREENKMLHTYQVSVAQNGRFIFRTDKNYGEMEIVPVIELIFSKFPQSEGFTVTINKFPAQFESSQVTEKNIKKIGYRPEVKNDL